MQPKLNYLEARNKLRALELKINDVAAQMADGLSDSAAQTKLDSYELEARPLREIVSTFEQGFKREQEASESINSARLRSVAVSEVKRLVDLVKGQPVAGTGVLSFQPDDRVRAEVMDSVSDQTELSILDLGSVVLVSAHMDLDFLAEPMSQLDISDRLAVGRVLTGDAKIAVLSKKYDDDVLEQLRSVFAVTQAIDEVLITFNN